MGEARQKHRSPLPRLPLRRALARVISVSLAGLLITLGALSIQMASGNDPALGPKLATAASPESSAPEDPEASELERDDEGDAVVNLIGDGSPDVSSQQSAPAPTTVQTAAS